MDRRKHPRFIKRLRTTLIVDHKSFTGISGDLSENGLFIRTNRSFAVNTSIEIEILLPDNRISSLRGSVRRTHISPLKSGIGIEITEKDGIFTDLVKLMSGEKDPDRAEKRVLPELHTISRLSCGAEKEGPKNNVQEKRRHKRIAVRNMKVDSEMPSASDVKIINLSMSGVLVKADRRLNIGNKYTLKIGYKEKVLFAKAVVIWSLLTAGVEDAKGDIKAVYLVGMQFTNVTNGKIEEIVSFIEADTREDTLRPGTESPDEIIEEIEDLFGRYKNKTLGYYGILNIEDFAGAGEIKKAYYKRARELHPDRHSYLPPGAREKLNTIFAYLTEAREILTNSRSKEKYDRSLIVKPVIVLSNKELARKEFEQGKIEFWNGNLPEAETFLHNAVSLDGSCGKYFYFYAKTLLKLGRSRDAEKAVKEALKIEPLNAEYLTEAGYIYDVMGLSHAARENFGDALRLQPANIKAHEGMMGLKSNSSVFRDHRYNPIKAFRKMIVK